MKIKELTAWLESIAPLSLQESYDNAGLITGNPETEITGVLVCLDSTEEIVMEAVRNKCNLIVAHHPIVFSGLKKINGKNYVERTVIQAIRNDIAIYAIHTNLDNVYQGVNQKIANKIGLKNLGILTPKKAMLRKLSVFVPEKNSEDLRSALFAAGAGNIGNYDSCSFNVSGIGTFRGNEDSNPAIGEKGQLQKEAEQKVEVIFEAWKERHILSAMKNVHPYEEVAYDVYSLENEYQYVGSGMIGELESEMEEDAFLLHLKRSMKAQCVRHTQFLRKKVRKVAICGGSGSFLLQDAIRQGADCFVSGDFKYHQFFDADGKILIADIGHYESEQFTMELLKDLILKKNTKFAVRLTELDTNPVNYI
ncbi:MAG: Nif3-like dinuclear metal center hexameric protein [Bacteroidetes bacterium]|nr:MAG: Nif3-like dinuclear metal center hexameric protein [Bacteroidota bacterium]REK06447.1 MAG: Nif3-like dinuclear metal center hexameric protein [Bacteroidota bacterium]REK33213.1 MAG: Nif3-like dinuclear metal center hexameric protein [Bacteroidota bacterium]REK47050.1 MAG: Nif3-like dinuclear metal center hexameric protein [Bacteroidota bacterium]